MENGTITNASITASSYYPQYPPWSARLRAGTEKGWYALPNDLSPWIQVDLGKPRWLKGLATQGKRFTVFVKTYKVAYSLDAVSWRIYHGNGTRDKVFYGNTDPYTVVTNILVKPVYTRFVRVYPLSWNDAIVLKLEFYGCLTTKIPSTYKSLGQPSERL
ncbi:hypothetical protein pdam_00019767 [Pocillopora damicornis]|uniref:F5/8 type C domain-containing protein n=1 Tax=Pocillopora damicornis TaxID=46731 RepID=A0A3M6U8B4_POCDA|nr:lactadherin-like [Pocillopora damicornis]RMX49764.1 hypothetical protein pdam_00019767 [Pocillopora damicornis]